eukprot:IDg15881t1
MLVQLSLSVELWSALKFLLTEIIISVLFANAWTAFVRRRTARLLYEGHEVTLLSTKLGRLTPANLVYRCHGPGFRSSLITGRIFVFGVNLLFLVTQSSAVCAEALKQSSNSSAGIPTYVIREHLLAADSNLSLVRDLTTISNCTRPIKAAFRRSQCKILWPPASLCPQRWSG